MEEGRRKKEEGRRKKEEGRRKKEEEKKISYLGEKSEAIDRMDKVQLRTS
ncbi:hypothetical protein QUB70_27715 [Microcoleus sp. A003_D6]